MSVVKPEVRPLGGGAWVVDYGLKWFRVRPNGEIVAREVHFPLGRAAGGQTRARKPTKVEVIAVRKWVAQATSAVTSDTRGSPHAKGEA